MKQLLIPALLTGLLGVAPAFADDLMDVYTTAQNTDPQWLGAQANNQAAQEATKQSLSRFLPNASLNANASRLHQDQNYANPAVADTRQTYNTDSWSLDITQPVFRMGNYAFHRQAKASVRRADALFAAEAQNLIIRVAQAYFDALSAEAELSSIQAEKKAIARQLEQAQRRFEVGLIAITDVHEAQASYDLVTAQEIVAQNSLSLAYVALQEITGQPYEQIADVRDEIPLTSPKPEDVTVWVDKSLQNNRSLEAAVAGIEVAQENAKLQKAGHYPTLDLVGRVGESDTTHGLSGANTDSSSLTLQLNVPLYEGGAVTSRTRQALAELEKARQDATQARRATERLARNAYLNVVADLSRIKALKQAVISAQSAVDATEAGFEVGTRTIVDVLNVQRELYRSRANYQQARYTYLLNGLKLKQATGDLAESDLAQVNGLLTD